MQPPPAPFPLAETESVLILVEGNAVTHRSWNLNLTHFEFVRRRTGQLPAGAWVGTVHKADGQVQAINSKTFYGNQLPAPDHVQAIVRQTFC
ncbi:MAG: hypothetical protein JSR82_20400 [Verrucomicrobia bacterium]|nr:hypothetical protein [Verrucomicrobiota bacterium]